MNGETVHFHSKACFLKEGHDLSKRLQSGATKAAANARNSTFPPELALCCPSQPANYCD